MNLLVAEDQAPLRFLLETELGARGYAPELVEDGEQAWSRLRAARGPTVALLDWVMPGPLDGPEVCRRVREAAGLPPIYLILVTSKDDPADLVAGLEAGADDYVRKPFDLGELDARIQVGLRTLGLQLRLADRVRELETALEQVRMLQGILPICAYCRKVRDDENYWTAVEEYVAKHLDTRFTHGICPTCFQAALGQLARTDPDPPPTSGPRHR